VLCAVVSADPYLWKAVDGDVFGLVCESFGPATLFRLPGYFGGEPTQPVPRDVVAVMIEGEPARWTPDFWVHDADAAAARAGELGGRVISPPADDGVGRTAVIADPAGAVFTITKIGVSAGS
jgi:hypothetical protein